MEGGKGKEGKNTYTLTEVAKHNTEDSVWIAIHGKVYDITQFLGDDDHPGGRDVVMSRSGGDASEDFDEIDHSAAALRMMSRFEIGTLVAVDATATTTVVPPTRDILAERPWPFWKALATAQNKNRCIDMARYAQFATVCHRTGDPSCRTVRVRGTYLDRAVVLSCDIRSAKCRDLLQRPRAELCWYFPLSKEQFRIRGHIAMVMADKKQDTTEIKYPDTLSSEWRELMQPTNATELAARQQERITLWKNLPNTTRPLFEWMNPGTPRPKRGVATSPSSSSSSSSSDDLDVYEPQPLSVDDPSSNFCMLLLFPDRCDYLSVPTTEQDNSIPLHHESLARPARGQRRWLHVLEGTDGGGLGAWSTRELNP